MLVALWDSPAADCLESAARSLSWMVERQDGVTCDALVRARQVDLGLVPAYHVLAAGRGIQVLPGGALSSWSFPHAQLQLSRPLQQVRTFTCTPPQVQEALMARVILKEHYGVDALPVAGDSADATLHSGSACETLQAGDNRLNLGQEWFELLQYPMVWALFVCASGTATPAMTAALKTLTSRAEEQLRQQDRNAIRLRLDDLALAGLTGLREYLYYYGAIEEMAELPYYQPDEAGISEPPPPWAT
ncbi:MAG: hypothetical protein OXU68_08175 [Bacteroidota bacterium]|nr:hypothetical protein [Bacteroidota bacterium]